MAIVCYCFTPLFKFCKSGSKPYIPYRPTPKDECQEMLHEKWMEQVYMIAPESKIRDMTIPASHDSATYGLNPKTPFIFTAQTQRLSIYDQLRVGARNIDLRYGPKGSGDLDVYTYHGPFMSVRLEETFIQIEKFIDENPNEFVVVSLQEEHAITDRQKSTIINLVQQYFTPRAITNKDTWFAPSTVTISQTIQNKKNFFVIADSSFIQLNSARTEQEYFNYEGIGIFHAREYYQSPWINTNKVNTLFFKDLYDLASERKVTESFIGTQMIMTTETKALDIWDYIWGKESLRIDHFTKQLQENKCMAYFIINNIQRHFSFVELDYLDYNPNLVRFLIGLNFPRKLEILNFTVDGEDLTTKAMSLVSKGVCLYIPDFQQSLGLTNKPSSFSVKFHYQGDQSAIEKSYQLKDISDGEFLLTYLHVTETKKKKISDSRETAPLPKGKNIIPKIKTEYR